MFNLIFALFHAAVFGALTFLYLGKEKGKRLDTALYALFSLLMAATLAASVLEKI